MTRVRTRWHFSRLLLLFSSSEALQARHCLTLLLLGLTSLRTALSCDEKTRPQSRDLSALPRYFEVRRYPERRDLGAPRVIPEWMQRENEASSMAGQSASDVASDDHSGDSPETQRDCDGSDPSVTKQAYPDDDVLASRVNDQEPRSGTASDYPGRKSGERLSDPAGTRRVRGGISSQSMKQREESANNWLGNQLGKRRGVPTLQVTSRRASVNRAVNEVQFRDGDNEAGLATSGGSHPSVGDLPEDAEDASIEAPTDRSYSREASSVGRLTGSRRDRGGGASSEAERAGLSADNLFAEIPASRANERTSDYPGRRSSRGDIDAAPQHRDVPAADRSDRGIVGFWVARQTHLSRRNTYALDNRGGGIARGSESDSAERLHESDGTVINDVIRNEFASANDSDVDAIAIDDLDVVGAVPMENQVELGGISEIGNRTGVDPDLGGAAIRPANCRNVACSKSSDEDDNDDDDDDLSVIRIKKFGTEESNGDRGYEDEDRSARAGEISTAPGNDSDTDIDIDSEAPFTGFEGSQKFPVKINHKSPPSVQVEKFDRRHFGPHKEDVLEETSTWYPSTVLPDLPKSPSRDVLPRKTSDGSDDVADEVDEADDVGEGTTEMDARRNDTRDESRPPGTDVPEGHLSVIESTPDERLAVTSNVTGSELEKATRDKNFSDGTARISSAEPIAKINVTILGLFEMTHRVSSRPEGASELQAAKLAVERVNELDILKRFRLRLIYNDTKCDSGVAVDRFFHALYSTRKKHLMPFLLGTACSEVTETLAKIVPYWNVIQVSFGSTAPALSDSNEYPLFLRTVAPDSSHNPARIALIKHFGWDTVTALSQTGDMYSLAVNDLVTELEQANITCTATITFAENDYKEQLRTLKELDTRIIIGSFSPRLAQRVLCEAWKLGMHGGDYAWILPGETIDSLGITGDWWHVGVGECSPSQLSQTLDGLIIVKSHPTVVGNETSASGLVCRVSAQPV
ncbi:PREDICTED: uncharacterized protein LOC105567863 [Vollenhovia emeryi]|uniref:uncharacterized protein LOC105567863 n=1 Tax=Vollenhovia emeryi TaxID=411798 RepID=UPI0005F4C08E|nr:PREDICTED: uncharacterized protein LOC105567863 [Vollenhovia emeryi]